MQIRFFIIFANNLVGENLVVGMHQACMSLAHVLAVALEVEAPVYNNQKHFNKALSSKN